MLNELVIINRPKSNVAESIRTLRTNLDFSFVDNDVKKLLITSSMTGEGKSFISANLACAFGMNNRKVLLIDCDLRKGRQHKLFDIKEKVGLSDLLLDSINNSAKYIVKTDIKNLSILPCGTTVPNPAELLGSEKMNSLVEKLSKNYDVIIFDAPPLNGITDTLLLTKLVDRVVLVSAIKKTPTELLEESKKSLELANAKIAGVVVNRINSKSSKYYYGKYYE